MKEEKTAQHQLLEAVSDRLIEVTTGPRILVLLTLVAVYAIAVMGPAYRRIETLSEGPGPLDFLIVYTPEQAYERIAAYGHQGRQYYATIALTLDTIFPIASAALFSLMLAYVFHRAFRGGRLLQRALVVPPAAMLADFLENISIVTMLLAYPRRLDPLALLASAFSTVKWTAIAAQATLVVIGLVAWLIRRRWGVDKGV